jgi:hypothetical protein
MNPVICPLLFALFFIIIIFKGVIKEPKTERCNEEDDQEVKL